MYDSFYGLTARPFQLTPDPRFWFESATHRTAMSYLGYGLAQGEGFIVITGEVGSGKTTLIGHVMQSIDPARLTAARLVSTQVSDADLLRLVTDALGIAVASAAKSDALTAIENFLHEEARAGRRTLLIVDEAQSLSVSALEELRMLSNFQLGESPLLQIVMLAQPEFRGTLGSPQLEQLRQRVIATHHLEAMLPEELEPYIMHRLRLVGWQGSPSFTPDFFDALWRATAGIPRRVNGLASRLLLHGAVEEKRVLDGNDVRMVVDDMGLSPQDLAEPLTRPIVATPLATPAPAPTVAAREAIAATVAPPTAAVVEPAFEPAAVDPVVDPVAPAAFVAPAVTASVAPAAFAAPTISAFSEQSVAAEDHISTPSVEQPSVAFASEPASWARPSAPVVTLEPFLHRAVQAEPVGEPVVQRAINDTAFDDVVSPVETTIPPVFSRQDFAPLDLTDEVEPLDLTDYAPQERANDAVDESVEAPVADALASTSALERPQPVKEPIWEMDPEDEQAPQPSWPHAVSPAAAPKIEVAEAVVETAANVAPTAPIVAPIIAPSVVETPVAPEPVVAPKVDVEAGPTFAAFNAGQALSSAPRAMPAMLDPINVDEPEPVAEPTSTAEAATPVAPSIDHSAEIAGLQAEVAALRDTVAALETRSVEQDAAIRRILGLLIQWAEKGDGALTPGSSGRAA